jgi:hypothetical protein
MPNLSLPQDAQRGDRSAALSVTRRARPIFDAKNMNRIIIITLAFIVLVAGCAAADMPSPTAAKVPFPHSSFVAEYTLDELGRKVIEQDALRRHPPQGNLVVLKALPAPREFQKLRALYQEGDRLMEYKNDDWLTGSDRGSEEPQRAFCLVRSDRIVKSIRIWPFDE